MKPNIAHLIQPLFFYTWSSKLNATTHRFTNGWITGQKVLWCTVKVLEKCNISNICSPLTITVQESTVSLHVLRSVSKVSKVLTCRRPERRWGRWAGTLQTWQHECWHPTSSDSPHEQKDKDKLEKRETASKKEARNNQVVIICQIPATYYLTQQDE